MFLRCLDFFQGISWERFAIDSVSSSCGQAKGDRFKLTVPFAKSNVTWNVLFDSHCPEMGPDFEFNDNSFLVDMDVDTLSTKVPGLAKWDPNHPDALVNVLLQLIACYKQHQVRSFSIENYSSLAPTPRLTWFLFKLDTVTTESMSAIYRIRSANEIRYG